MQPLGPHVLFLPRWWVAAPQWGPLWGPSNRGKTGNPHGNLVHVTGHTKPLPCSPCAAGVLVRPLV